MFSCTAEPNMLVFWAVRGGTCKLHPALLFLHHNKDDRTNLPSNLLLCSQMSSSSQLLQTLHKVAKQEVTGKANQN